MKKTIYYISVHLLILQRFYPVILQYISVQLYSFCVYSWYVLLINIFWGSCFAWLSSEPKKQPVSVWAISFTFVWLNPDQNHVHQCLNSKRRTEDPHWLQTPGRICVNRPLQTMRKQQREPQGAEHSQNLNISTIIYSKTLYRTNPTVTIRRNYQILLRVVSCYI